jgi:sec-independent protein translocase protein TatA
LNTNGILSSTFVNINLNNMIQFNILLGIVGVNEIIVILIVVLLLFGGKKIPELMRGLGKGMKEFKDASRDIQEEIKNNDPTKELRK